MAKEFIVYSEKKADFETQVASGSVDTSQIGVIAETAEFWVNGSYYPLVLLTDYLKKDDAVNFAKDLTGTIEATSEEFTFRPSAGDKSIRDESALIRRIKGNTSVWGQLVEYNSTLTLDGDVIIAPTVSATLWATLVSKHISAISGHKYLFLLDALNSSYNATDNYAVIAGVNRVYIGTPYVKTATATETWTYTMRFTESSNGLRLQTQVFDLTQIFGAGNEPATIEEFRKYYPDAYYPYCVPEVRPMCATGIETIGANAFNEEDVVGGKLNADGTVTSNDVYSVAKIEIVSNETYTLTNVANGALATYTYAFYDSNDVFLSTGAITNSVTQSTYVSGDVIVPMNARYMRVVVHNDYMDSCCVNLKHTGTLDPMTATYFKDVRMLPDIAKYFPNGMHGIGDVYDEINENYAIKRFGVRAYEEGDRDNTEVVTDGTTTVYVLASPVTTPLTEPIQLDYKVADYGTEKMLSTLPSAPFRADIVYQFNAADRIRDNERNIERLENKVSTIEAYDGGIKTARAYLTDGLIYDSGLLYALPTAPEQSLMECDVVLATQDFVIENIPTEIATATQLMQLTAAPANNTYLANVTYVWTSSLTTLTIAALQASADNAYDDVWRIRFGATASTALTIQPTVYWEGGVAPSFTTWGICELEFRKDTSSGSYLGRWRVYK